MAQDDFGNIDPNTTSGVDLTNLLEAQRDADHSNHSGTTRPSYVVPGMLWIKTGITPWEIIFFDGSNDIVWATMDTATHIIELVHKGSSLADVAISGDFTDLINAPAGGLTFVTLNDTTPDFFDQKFVQGGGFLLTINNPGANEELQIDHDFVSQAEAETGSDQIKPMNALRTLQAILANAPPPGIIEDYAGTSVPLGYLDCDGAAVNRTTFAALFTAIGTAWGIGDGSTTFNVPALARHTTIGSGGSGTGTIGNAVGDTGGEEDHTLSSSEIPSVGVNFSNAFRLSGRSLGVGPDNVYMSNAGSTQTVTTAGGGGDHNNMQKSAVVKKIIKT